MNTLLKNKPEANPVCLGAVSPGHRMDGTTKKTIRATLLALLAVAALYPASAQVYFTRILEGDIANDEGNFTGCGWGDYDNDGYVDLFVGSELGQANRLYHNNGNGNFTRVTTGSIFQEKGSADSVVWGDYDNDGDLDLFISNYETVSYSATRDSFYRNEGNGTFTRITQGAWVNDSSRGVGAAWGDYDNDGFLDLYVANSEGAAAFLYRNRGDGSMIATTGPVTSVPGNFIGCAWTDLDADGDIDLVVAGGLGGNNLQFRNNGNGTFTRITTGVFVKTSGRNSAMAPADYDNDGDVDLLVSGGNGEDERLYRNNGTNGFVRITEGALVTSGGDSRGAAWGDYDNDGYLDVFIANDLGENNFLYHNEGNGTFSQVFEGPVVSDGGRSWGCAWADYDNDGDLDLFVANGAANFYPPLPPIEPSFLYRNDGGTNNWLILKLVGTASNRSAIGAKVRVLATIRGKSFWQLREISGGSGWCSQNDLRAHFGLGDATTVETVRIEWPSGIAQELKNVAARQILTITEHQEAVATAPNLTAAKTESGAVQLTLTGQTNRLYVFEASTNLVQWTKVAVRTNLTGSVELTDSVATKFPQRFYRAVAP